MLRWALLLAAILAAGLLLSGCGGGGAPTALAADAMTRLGTEMVAIEAMPVATLHAYAGTSDVKGDLELFYSTALSADYRATYRDSLADAKALHGFVDTAEKGNATAPKAPKGYNDAAVRAEAEYLLGYAQEVQVTRGTADFYRRNYGPALLHYAAVAKSRTGFGTQAQSRIAAIRYNEYLRAQDTGRRTLEKDVKTAFYPLRTGFKVNVWDRTPLLAGDEGNASIDEKAVTPAPDKVNFVATPQLVPREAAAIALQRLDYVYQTAGGTDTLYYASVKSIMDFFTRLSPHYGVVWALIFLALLVKLLTIWPTAKSYRSMRDMQRLQPLLAALQEKHKGDQAKIAEEQMKLYKEHGVNPMGGCLPMLIQIPVFIIVYQAVMVYAYNFANTSFLWISSLALPDIPLLLLYLGSMVISQKLTPTTSADPQVQAQQRMMTYFMPIMLMFVLINFASAFVLYWLFLNIFSAAHQYYLIRSFSREEAAGAPAASEAAPAQKTPEKEHSTHTLNTRKKGKKS
jgi:YidC/Oxa1 family membrane protein insertase